MLKSEIANYLREAANAVESFDDFTVAEAGIVAAGLRETAVAAAERVLGESYGAKSIFNDGFSGSTLHPEFTAILPTKRRNPTESLAE